MVERHEHTGIDSPQISGRNLLKAPQPTIADPSGGVTQDAEARAAINDIIDALQTLGLIK